MTELDPIDAEMQSLSNEHQNVWRKFSKEYPPVKIGEPIQKKIVQEIFLLSALIVESDQKAKGTTPQTTRQESPSIFDTIKQALRIKDLYGAELDGKLWSRDWKPKSFTEIVNFFNLNEGAGLGVDIINHLQTSSDPKVQTRMAKKRL